MLPRFIDSICGQVDEWIVVDTGSTDNTVELLTKAGAQVFHVPWTNDFAAARNAALSKATGEWVLFLDPDEFVSPDFFQEVRRLCADDVMGAATIRMVNELPNGHRRESQLLRLFRRHESIRFQYAIHEDVNQSIFSYLKAHQKRLGTVHAPILHVGYAKQYAQAKGKQTRDIQILEETIRANEHDVYAHFKLMEQARFWAQQALWRKAAERAHILLDKIGHQALAQCHFGGEMLVLISLGLKYTPREALCFFDEWKEHIRPSAAFYLRRAEILELLGRFQDAEADFKKCMHEASNFGNMQLSSTRPLLGLARLNLMRERRQEARELIESALTNSPKDAEALLAGAVVACSTAGAQGLEQWKKSRISRDNDSAELQLAVGEAAYQFHLFATASHAFENALRLGAPSTARIQLARSLLAQGHLDWVFELIEPLSKESPDAALGVMLLKLLVGQDSEMELDISPQTADAFMRQWVEALLKNTNPHFAAQFERCANALSDSFPWIADYSRVQHASNHV